jgi:hypothetical protein
MHMNVQGRLMQAYLIEIHQVFAKKRFDNFLTLRSFQPTLWLSSAESTADESPVVAESFSYFILSLGYLHYYDVYRHEAGRLLLSSHLFNMFYHFTFPPFSFILT